MFNNLKGLSTDNAALDLISSGYYGLEASHDLDQAPQMFFQGSLDHFQSLGDDINPAQLLARLNPDLNKSYASPKRENFNSSGLPVASKTSMLGFRNDQEMSEEDKLQGFDDEDGSDSGSDSDPNKKRGKYRTYTDDEKSHIITFMMKHGMQKTLEIFSGGEHKITKRKLKSWLDGQNKIKGVKGRKSNDPIRDQQLYEWCMDFQNEHGRPPSRKESTKKALELSGDPNFQASKGWLDKFSRKYNIEFTPLKIIPPRARKQIKTGDSDSGSATTSTLESTLTGSISPFKETKSAIPELGAKKNNSAPVKETDRETGLKPSLLFSSALKPAYQQQVQQAPQQPSPLYQQGQNNSAIDGGLNSLESSAYQGFSAPMEGGQAQGFSYPFYSPVDYTMPYLLNYSNVTPSVSCRTAYPMNYPMNLPLNYQMQFAENLQRLQQMMGKEGEGKNENQKGI